MASHYDPTFFEGQTTGSRDSARTVLPQLQELLRPQSILDVGCGTGAWLSEWRKMGVTDVLGVDGSYVDPDQLEIPPTLFCPADLSRPLDLGRRFDLVECLEVAEHLDASVADALVESLCRHGDGVLFSAAVPGQGGAHHVNERWPSYWVPKFEREGFELFDILRPRLWADARAEVWYRQNLLIFARGSVAEDLRRHAWRAMPVLDVVHPELYTRPHPPLYRRVYWGLPRPVQLRVRAALRTPRHVLRRAMGRV